MSTNNRPLSPHLQVYRPQLTSMLSIVHRLTGMLLCAGSLLLVYWLFALAGGEATYIAAQETLSSWWCQLLLFLFTVATFYHLANGIRHLYWDAGQGFELESVYTSGWAVVIATGVLTLLCWIIAYVAA